MVEKLMTLVLVMLLVSNCKGIGLGDKLGAGQPPWMLLNNTFAFAVVWEATEVLIKNNNKSMIVWLVRCDNCSITAASLEETGNFVLLDRSFGKVLVAGKYRLSMNRQGIELYFQDYLNQSYWGIINKQLNTSDLTMTSTPKFTFGIDGHLAFFDANGSSIKKAATVGNDCSYCIYEAIYTWAVATA
ncbi:hypothetical protein SELMODRAFT_404427 [Selaginella moellendorffii]|uniref:Bulb-type lectin domain-containing protein n=1 Tax=Selaginella moellendorffii TaxID=88036 RepID=D8QVA7_SELML|nr:hypothetical protein SELMODRAFT_404427 [Selaginella moellendorffii]